MAPRPPEWRGLSNGRFLAAVVSGGYDGLLSNDKNLVHQRKLSLLNLAIVILPTNKLSVLSPRSDDIAATLRSVARGETVSIALDGSRLRRTAGPGGAWTMDALPPLAPFGS